MSSPPEVLASNKLYTPDGQSGFLIQIIAVDESQGKCFLLVKSKFTKRRIHGMTAKRFSTYGDAKRAQVEEYHKMLGQGLKDRRPVNALSKTG